MGRPWWYDSYWEKQGAPRRRLKAPKRRFWVWLSLVVFALLLTAASTGFKFALFPWIRGTVFYLCRLLSVGIFLRAMISWLPIGGYNKFVMVLDDATEPILWPLRRAIPLIGRFDVTPLVAILVLYLIPVLVDRVLP
ncbi:MAG: YggT family protein [Chloroflexi bacterium]|nr:YggT family protein [Chloroflexota bacterium]